MVFPHYGQGPQSADGIKADIRASDATVRASDPALADAILDANGYARPEHVATVARHFPLGTAAIEVLTKVLDDAEMTLVPRDVALARLSAMWSSVRDVDSACRVMHDAYEDAAVFTGWVTQERSRVPWDDLPEPNKATMRIAVVALLDYMSTVEPPRAPVSTPITPPHIPHG